MLRGVSVITVCFNDLPNLKKTIASVQALKHKPAEVIVIDGASTDGTRDYLARLDPALNVRVLSEPDRGIYDAMNKGIDLARGALLHFLNAGDVVFGEPYRGADSAQVLAVQIVRDGRTFRQRRPSLFVYSYCHQGIIFPATRKHYDLRYRISSDLDFVISHLPRGVGSLPLNESAGVVYDLAGISQRMKLARDREMVLIYFRRGRPLLGVLFALGIVVKAAGGPLLSRLKFLLDYTAGAP